MLSTQIAIAEKDFANAKVLLGRLFDEYQTSNSKEFLFTVCQVAIPAFRVDELRETALPILNALLQREKELNNLTDAEMSEFLLVRAIDQYLRTRTK